MGQASSDGTKRGPGRATIRDVAARAGVSVATVSRILNGTYRAPADTVDKVMVAVAELDYVVNTNARMLGSSTSETVGIVMTSLTSPFYVAVAAGVEEQATTEGRLCVVATTQDDPERELAALAMMRERGVEAVILAGGTLRTSEHQARLASIATALDRAGARLALCMRPPLDHEAPVEVVGYDNEGGAYAAVSYLLSVGHRRIVYLGATAEQSFTTGRLAGYRKALANYKVPHSPALITEGAAERPAVQKRIETLLADSEEFTAIFAATDSMASHTLAALRTAGVRVPEEVSVIGYNDDPIAADLSPALTTVHVPQAELGRIAVRRALHPHSVSSGDIKLATHVVIRDSVCPPGRDGVRSDRTDGTH